VEFIYFGISYDNPCSPLSFSPLPAPRSPLQAHVLASSPTCACLLLGVPEITASTPLIDRSVGIDREPPTVIGLETSNAPPLDTLQTVYRLYTQTPLENFP
jgi:hypothetical protein